MYWKESNQSNKVRLWSEMIKKESDLSLLLDSTAAGASMTERQQERPELPNDTTTTAVNATTIGLRPCESECRVTKQTLGPFSQHVDLDYDSSSADVIFLLGYPYSGTSATHFLLSTSGNVRTLSGFKSLIPNSEEGWSLTGVKGRYSEEQRWDGALEWLNWTQLAQSYGVRWNRSTAGGGKRQPLKVENSPPEIQAPKALKEAFEPMYGKVKFILLVRGDCTYSGEYALDYRHAGYQKVLREFREDTFVVRYEDLCLAWDEVYRDLVKWEPLLADIGIPTDLNHPHKAGGRRRLHTHDAVSIRQYCESSLPRWNDGLKPRPHRKGKWKYQLAEEYDMKAEYDILAEYGYDQTNTC